MERTLLIDTNVLVLLIVGSISPDEIYNHKRLQQYNIESHRVLLNYIKDYQTFWVTSHVVAETSNLLKSHNERLTIACRKGLAGFLMQSNVHESHMRTVLLVEKLQALILRGGIPDCGLVQKSKRTNNLLTDDFDLYTMVVQQGLKATKFEHLLAKEKIF